MSESAIADFRARIAVGKSTTPEPGRVVLSRRRLVLARDDGRTTIPLSSVFDLAVGDVPGGAADFFDHTVTIGYRDDDESHVAIVEGEDETIERFASIAYRAILGDTEALVVHPAKVGGRVTDADPTRERLSLTEAGIVAGDCGIDLSTVVQFERGERTLAGTRRPTLTIRHFRDDGTVTSVLTLPSSRRLNVLGRYLRKEYTKALSTVRELELSDPALESLVGLYSGADATNLAGVLGVESGQVTMLLNDLEEKGLVAADGSLSATGRMVVADRIESVNF